MNGDPDVPTRLAYGPDPSQWVDRHDPAGPSRGTVVVIHGGFWKAEYDASLGHALAGDLAARGWTALNVEYRRVGNGGGFPQTFDDIHAAIGLAAPAAPADPAGPVVTLGHSAGGHLATWAAARQRFEQWSDGVAVTHVVSQAGVVDLATAHEHGLGSGAVAALLGPGEVQAVLDRADPMRQLPLDVPVWCLHARDDDLVPISQSEDYVEAATAAGATATLVEVDGGHFDLIDVRSAAWRRVVDVFDGLAPKEA